MGPYGVDAIVVISSAVPTIRRRAVVVPQEIVRDLRMLACNVFWAMRPLPVADPGTPDKRSPVRYLLWLIRVEARTVTAGVVLGIIWMLSQALMPAAIGKAIDQGIAEHNKQPLLLWASILFVLGVTQAVAGIMRHRFAVRNWLAAAYRSIQVTVAQANRLGATLPKKLGGGEIVSIGTSDISHIGHALDITARGAGSVVAIVAVAIILLHASLPLGLVVVLGVPVLMTVVSLLIRPLHKRQQAYRDEQGALTTRAADIVSGLRVLRGVGGEAVFAARYRAHSQELRAAGVRVARVESYLEAAQVLLPGIFVVLVTWLGARFAVAGQISPGQLVAFYGYAVFLIFPLRTLTEAVDKTTRAHVAARRVVRLLSIDPEMVDPETPAATPSIYGELVDPESGVVIAPGIVTAIAADDPQDAVQIADRLGRYTEALVTLSGVRLRDLNRRTVRELILVADNDARLFTGPLRDGLAAGQHDRAVSDDEIYAALQASSATEVIEALDDGLDAIVAERGREFSGGQQQRLRLARALIADPPILVLVEPTSAVDAHTEARIAKRLGAARSGRTTVVATTSPLMLDRADHVIYVEDGKVIAEGRHRDLLAMEPRYEAAVTRGEG
jgi:ABC-type multidrug transport system fused ATPase/permease subunit